MEGNTGNSFEPITKEYSLLEKYFTENFQVATKPEYEDGSVGYGMLIKFNMDTFLYLSARS